MTRDTFIHNSPDVPELFLMHLAAMANEISQSPTEGEDKANYKVVRKHVDNSELAFCIWSDPLSPTRVDCIVVKGEHRLHDVVATKQTVPMKVTAIPCFCAEQAYALRQVLADERH